MKNWYLARSKPQQESWFIDSLTSLGEDVYFPRIVRVRRGKRSDEPLFPTYMFCQLDEDFLERPTIRWAPGLSCFLGTNGSPTCIPASLIKYFQDSVSQWNNHLEDSENTVFPGYSTRTLPPEYYGLDAIFDRYIDQRRRCKLLLQAIGNPIALNLERDYLRMAIQVL